MQRGEVWWAFLQRPAGRRPVVVLTRDQVLPGRALVTVAPITSTVRGLRTEVIVDERDGLSRRSAINLDNITTIRSSDFDELISRLSPERMAQVREAIIIALDL